MNPEKGPTPESAPGKPDETKYDLMEIAAKSGGAEAEARRIEMGKWSETTGAYAEGAAARQRKVEDQAIKDGRSDRGVQVDVRRAAQKSAEDGESMHGTGTVRPASDVRATSDKRIDMTENDHFSSHEKTYRSPATIRQQNEAASARQQKPEKNKGWWKRITGQ